MSNSILYPKAGDVLVAVLDHDIRAAGIPVDGLAWLSDSQQVRVDYQDGATPEQLAAGAALVAAHVPVDPIQAIADGAEGEAAAIPGWAHWTEAEAQAWWSTNIDDPIANAPTVTSGNVVAVVNGIITILGYMSAMLWALARMIIALRNKQWPNLQN